MRAAESGWPDGVAWVLAASALLGCAASTASPATKLAPRAAQSAPAAPSFDWGLRLAQRLPAGAHFCTVLRPQQLPGEKLPSYAQLSQGSELATLAGLELDGYAEVRREGRSGPGRRLILLHSRLPLVELRAVLEGEGPLRLEWVEGEGEGDPGCSHVDCPARARVDADGVVRIELGHWPADLRAGAEQRCVERAAEEPAALEVSARRTSVSPVDGSLGMPLGSVSVVRVVEAGLLVARAHRLPSEDLARLLAQRDLELDWLPEAETQLGTELARFQQGAELHTRVRVLWDDLLLAGEDRERQRIALRYAQALQQLVPDNSVPIDDVDAVLRQAELLDTLRQTSGAGLPAWSQRRRELLQRALTAHPADERLTRALAAELPAAR